MEHCKIDTELEVKILRAIRTTFQGEECEKLRKYADEAFNALWQKELQNA